MWPAMRKGTIRGSRPSMKHDQFYHDNDQLAFYKCSIVNILVSAYWHQHTADTLSAIPASFFNFIQLFYPCNQFYSIVLSL